MYYFVFLERTVFASRYYSCSEEITREHTLTFTLNSLQGGCEFAFFQEFYGSRTDETFMTKVAVSLSCIEIVDGEAMQAGY